MIRGLYIAATGMLAESARQDVIANNLANVATTGFKRSETTARPFGDMLLRNLGVPGAPEVGTLATGAEVSGVTTIQNQGPLRSTGNALDVALTGTGFLTVETQGGRRYTRAGDLEIDGQGRLTTAEGNPVLGEDGPIRLEAGEVQVSTDGTVTQGGTVRGRLRIVALDATSVRAEGQSLVTGREAGTATASVRQRYLEGSTVNTVTEMVDLISVMRRFEANQKAVQAQDEALGQAVTKVGAMR